MRKITDSRQLARMLSVGVVALSAAMAGGIGSAKADEDVHFLLDWIPSGEMAAYYAGWQKGFWKDEGVNIKISRGYGSGDTVSKVASNAADFGIAGISAIFSGRERGKAPVKAISALYTHSPHSLFVLKSSGIKGFKDLAGKTIGITPGNSHKLHFPVVAERTGLDPKAVRWVNSDASAMSALLIAKRIDAAPFYSIHHYYQNKAAKKNGEEISVLPFVEAGFAIYSATILTTEKTINERPETVKKFLRGLHTSLKWANNNQQEACKLHVKKVPEVALDDCMGSLKAMLGFVFSDHSAQTGMGRFDAERLKFTYGVTAKSQKLDAGADPQNALDTRFLPKG
jgi:NitT/TauT family transport system substrate-binding protein